MAVTKSQHAGGQKGDTAAVADVRHLKSPLEINLIRLMHKCEQRALDGSAEVATDWRQHTYIACLRDFLKKLQANPVDKPSVEDLTEYKRRISLLETNLETMKQSLNNEAAPQSAAAISENNVLDLDSTFDNTFQKSPRVASEEPKHINQSESKKVENNAQFLNSPKSVTKSSEKGSSTSGHVELFAKTSAQPLKDMRNELLGNSATRLRNKKSKPTHEDEDAVTNDSVEAILSRHNAAQEKIADDMLKLARSLKQTSLTANELIKRDQDNLSRANEIAAKNYDKLQTETVRVSNTKPLGCQWWLFVLLGIVCLVFIWVVFLIKIT